jgi:hypothetical protein
LNAKLDDTLVSLDFWRTPLEHAIYIQRNVYVQLVVEVYVDNLVIIGSGHDDIKWFKEEMMGYVQDERTQTASLLPRH